LEAVGDEVAVRLEVPGPRQEAVLAFPCQVLATFAGKDDGRVTLTVSGPGHGLASWSAGDGRQAHGFPVVEPSLLRPFPSPPVEFQTQPENFLAALAEAGRTAEQHGVRFWLSKVLLAGRAGQVVATDGRQLLAQNGFSFPWPDDVLVESLDVWDRRELRDPGPVAVGRSESHVFVAAGPWTFALRGEPAARFPKWSETIPKGKEVLTRWRLAQEDISTLLKALPRLPGARDERGPVTLRLGQQGVVLAQGQDTPEVEELVLAASPVEGFQLTLATDRRYLRRALQLGLTELEVVSPDRPVCCRDATRTFVWMPLSAEDAVPRKPTSTHTSKESVMSNKNDAEAGTNGATGQNPEAPPDPLTEAEALRSVLQEAQSRLGRLELALKQHRRQAKALQAAVASLRQLPPLAP
jgi:hypothetical protein